MAKRMKSIELTDDDDKTSPQSRMMIYKYNDNLYIEKDPRCYVLSVRSKELYYPLLNQAFTKLSHVLLEEHFGRIPNEEKNDIKRILRAIEEHDKMIKEMFKGY